MRIVTYNVHGWLTADHRVNCAAVADVLAGTKADVIGLNEVLEPYYTPDAERSGLSLLAERLGMHVAFGACLTAELAGHGRLTSYANALLSRHPLSPVRSGLFRHREDKQQRGFLTAGVNDPAGRVYVTITHLDHTDESVRLTQWQELHEQLDAAERPRVIMGDFNCIHPREHEDRPGIYKALREVPAAAHLVNDPDGPKVCARVEQDGYSDSVLVLGRSTDGSFVPAAEPARFDYIWVDAALAPRVTDSAVIHEPFGEEASDHRPVYADLELNGFSK